MAFEVEQQRQMLRLYGELVCRWDELGGKLLFAAGEGSVSAGLTVAGSIAGAATLVVDADMAATKRVMRTGGVDFVVNTLDEALRVLKNEIRQKRPLGVALTAVPEEVVAEMMERGVLPDVCVGFGEKSGWGFERSATLQFGERVEMSERLQAWLAARGWEECVVAAGSRQAMRETDTALVGLGDDVRRRWVSRISQYFRVQEGFERWVWMTAEERAGLSGFSFQ